MNYRTLGNSELVISELSLGCMSLPTDMAEAKLVIDAALDAGINYFDTADLYDFGVNEEIVGAALKEKRQDVYIATKVGNRWTEGEPGWRWDATPAYIQEAVYASLKRLGTDYIDLYQLHGGTIEDNLDAVIDTFEGLKKDGLIRAYGISSIRPNVFVPFSKHDGVVSNMMQYSMLDRRAEEWFNTLAAQNVSVVTRGSIAKGLLSNRWREKLVGYMSYNEGELESLLAALTEQYGDLHALALAYNLQHTSVASTVIGARTKEQLLGNLQAYEVSKSIHDFAFANEILKKDVYTEHR